MPSDPTSLTGDEVENQKDTLARLLEYTLKNYGMFKEAYENYTHDTLRENYQLMCLYDALLVKRQQEATRLIRGTINIPKMQPELYARLAQEAKMLIGGAPIWRVNPPRSAKKEVIDRVKGVEECVNDLFNFDGWFWHWYSAKFWAQLAPYCVIEERYSKEFEFVPDGSVNYTNDSLNFVEKMTYCGPRTRVWFPWEIFYDITFPEVEPPVFTRYLMSDEELEEKLSSREYKIPEGMRVEIKGGTGTLRNYGLEIIRSVPKKAGEGLEDKRHLKDQHEVLCCLGYFADSTGKRRLKRWWVLNQKAVVKGPEDVTQRKTAMSYILCATRRVPGFGFGLPPGDSAKQIQRATNQTFNGRHEALLYGLVPPFLLGEGQTFTDDKPVVAPATAIRLSGDARNIQVLQSRVSPTEADSILGYLDAKGLLATNNNPGSLGSFKQGTPPSAMETGDVAQGQDTILGMFMLTEESFFQKWAALKYWTFMENGPLDSEINGRAYHKPDLIIGEPQFDLPQLGEAAGRTSDKIHITALFSQLSQIFQVPGLTKDSNPQLFALIEKYALALNQTWISEVTDPVEEKGKVDPAGIPDEMEMFLQQVEQQNAMAEAAAAQPQNGKPKGASQNGKKAKS